MSSDLFDGTYDPLGAEESTEDQSGRQLEAPYTVNEVLLQLKTLVTEAFPYTVRVVGETSSLSIPASGHCYFTLKDEKAQLSAVAWKSTMQKLPFKLQNGMQIVCSGRLDVYPGQGRCQLVVTSIKPVGTGAYELALKQLEAKLRREGLFDQKRKRPLPPRLSRVGVATSLTGAAIRDFLNILAERCKHLDVVVAQTKVQGEGAAQDIVNAIELLNAQRETLHLDALALIRGGGSVEDLAVFNDEGVVRAVAKSQLPVVTGIGHEIDTSLCDLASDVHAFTPSQAAILLSPVKDSDCLTVLGDWKQRLARYVEQKVKVERDRLSVMRQNRIFTNPYEVLYEKRAQNLNEFETKLTTLIEKQVAVVEKRCAVVKEQLKGRDPKAILSRGYSFTRRLADHKILRSSEDVKPGQVIETTLSKGVIRSVIIE